jgi:GNAT superfamily N-acetyltransferase
VRELFREYEQALDAPMCFQDFGVELAGLPGEYAPPRGRLYLAAVAGGIAGCVAFRPVDDAVVELKRLYVRPAFRGQKIGRALVQRTIDDARALACRALVLETQPSFREARALYASFGFRECAPYAGKAAGASEFFELKLARGV